MATKRRVDDDDSQPSTPAPPPRSLPPQRAPTVIWGSVADLDASLTKDDFEALFKDPAPPVQPAQPAEPPRGRPAAVVEEVNREFRADPVEALRRNVNYHMDGHTLNALAPEVREIAEAHDRQARVADAMWKNEDFQFYKLVQGFTLDNSLVDRELEGRSTGTALLQAQPLSGIERQPFITERPDIGYPLAFMQNFGPGETAYGNAAPAGAPERPSYTTTQEHVRVLTNVDRLLAQPQVSGELQMSTVMKGGVDQALVQLSLMNPAKYRNRDRKHFFRHHAIMVLFAKLVATIIMLNKMPSDGQYHKNVDEPRRKANTAFWLDQLDKTCTWDASAAAFRPASAPESERTVAAKRQRLMDAYNPSTWFA